MRENTANKLRVLVVVDYQNDFVNGVLGTPQVQAINKNIQDLLHEFSPVNNLYRVIITKDSHSESSYMDTREGKHLTVPHCIYDTEGHELYGSVRLWYESHKDNPYVNLVEKSNFGSLDLTYFTSAEEKVDSELVNATTLLSEFEDDESHKDIYIEATERYNSACEELQKILIPEEIHICGTATNICVLSNAIILQTQYPQAELYIHKSACASYDKDLHEKALEIMMGLGMNIVD